MSYVNGASVGMDVIGTRTASARVVDRRGKYGVIMGSLKCYNSIMFR